MVIRYFTLIISNFHSNDLVLGANYKINVTPYYLRSPPLPRQQARIIYPKAKDQAATVAILPPDSISKGP